VGTWCRAFWGAHMVHMFVIFTQFEEQYKQNSYLSVVVSLVFHRFPKLTPHSPIPDHLTNLGWGALFVTQCQRNQPKSIRIDIHFTY
jgi:hypothetical protein